MILLCFIQIIIIIGDQLIAKISLQIFFAFSDMPSMMVSMGSYVVMTSKGKKSNSNQLFCFHMTNGSKKSALTHFSLKGRYLGLNSYKFLQQLGVKKIALS